MGNLNTPLPILDRSVRQKINKDIQDLNSALDQMNLIDICRTLHPKSTEYTFFSAPHSNYSKIKHTSRCETILSKCKRTKLIPTTLKPQLNKNRRIRKSLKPYNYIKIKQLAPE